MPPLRQQWRNIPPSSWIESNERYPALWFSCLSPLLGAISKFIFYVETHNLIFFFKSEFRLTPLEWGGDGIWVSFAPVKVCERHLLNDSTATDCHRLLLDGRLFTRSSLLFEKIKWREKCFQLKRFRAESEICCADVSYGWNFTINTWPTSSTPTFLLTRKWFFIEKHILDLHLFWLANGGRGTFLFFLVRGSALSRTFTTLWLVVVSRFYNSLHCTFRHFRQVKGGKWRTGAATTILFWFIMIAIDFHFHLSCACLLFSCISRGQYDRQGFPFFFDFSDITHLTLSTGMTSGWW